MNNITEKCGGGCTFSGPGRGDCEHFVGLPGVSIPGQHDGPDDTVDAYGKPNGWCWSCWKSHRIATLESTLESVLKVALECIEGVVRGDYDGNGQDVLDQIKEVLHDE